MPSESEAAARRLLARCRLHAQLTVIQGRTQLLQRKLARLEGLDEAHRRMCDENLAVIVAAVEALVAQIDALADAAIEVDDRD